MKTGIATGLLLGVLALSAQTAWAQKQTGSGESNQKPSCEDDGVCCPTGYRCMVPRGGREMRCVGKGDGQKDPVRCEKEDAHDSSYTMVGGSYCTWGPDYECFSEGWPSCCMNDEECPEEHPECEAKGEGGEAPRCIAAQLQRCDDDNMCACLKRLKLDKCSKEEQREINYAVREECAKEEEGGNMCCKAMTASCLACAKNMSVEEYCARAPETTGCEKDDKDDEGEEVRACCKAMTAQCLACTKNMTEEQYCKREPETAGCKRTTASGGQGASTSKDKDTCSGKKMKVCKNTEGCEFKKKKCSMVAATVDKCAGKKMIKCKNTMGCEFKKKKCSMIAVPEDVCKGLKQKKCRAAKATCKWGGAKKGCSMKPADTCNGKKMKKCKNDKKCKWQAKKKACAMA